MLCYKNVCFIMKGRPGFAFIFHTHSLYTKKKHLCSLRLDVLILSTAESVNL